MKIFYSLIILLLSSCKDSSEKKEIFDSGNSYPRRKFSSVALLSVDSVIRKIYSTRDLQNQNLLIQTGRGLGFIDTSGKPIHNHYIEKILDSNSVKELLEVFKLAFLSEGSEHLDKDCFPVYREAVIFYDFNKKPIAYVNVCFTCELTEFNPFINSINDFDNTNRWEALRRLFDNNGIKIKSLK
jgi:hypothetical protein